MTRLIHTNTLQEDKIFDLFSNQSQATHNRGRSKSPGRSGLHATKQVCMRSNDLAKRDPRPPIQSRGSNTWMRTFSNLSPTNSTQIAIDRSRTRSADSAANTNCSQDGFKKRDDNLSYKAILLDPLNNTTWSDIESTASLAITNSTPILQLPTLKNTDTDTTCWIPTSTMLHGDRNSTTTHGLSFTISVLQPLYQAHLHWCLILLEWIKSRKHKLSVTAFFPTNNKMSIHWSCWRDHNIQAKRNKPTIWILWGATLTKIPNVPSTSLEWPFTRIYSRDRDLSTELISDTEIIRNNIQ